MKILYVEDEAQTREALAKYLNRHFGKIFTASDGLEGLKIFEDQQPGNALIALGMILCSLGFSLLGILGITAIVGQSLNKYTLIKLNKITNIIPGMTVAAKLARIEVPPTQAYKIIFKLGGISKARTEALDINAEQ